MVNKWVICCNLLINGVYWGYNPTDPITFDPQHFLLIGTSKWRVVIGAQVAYPAPDISSRLWVWEQELPCAGVFWQARDICTKFAREDVGYLWISVGMLAWCWLMLICWDFWCEFSGLKWCSYDSSAWESQDFMCLGDGRFRSFLQGFPKMSGFFWRK